MHKIIQNTISKSVRLSCALAMIGITPAYALDQITTYIPAAEKVGHGRLSVMIWDVYDASLFAPKGTWNGQAPFALQLEYLRNIPAEKIIERTMTLIRKQGMTNEMKLADWHAQLTNIFPDVDENTNLTGIYTSHKETIFLKNNKEIGRIKDPKFGQYFFNIWLGTQTTAPELRQKLLGQM